MNPFLASRRAALLLAGALSLAAPSLPAQLPPGSAGFITGWGRSSRAELAAPYDLRTNASALAASGFSAGVRGDGAVAVWGVDAPVLTSLSGARSVAAGLTHVLALLTNGAVAAWGDSSYKQTNVPAGLAGVASIAAGDYHSLALLSNGTVRTWGSLTNVPAAAQGASLIVAGYEYSAAIRAGRLVQWTDPYHTMPGQYGGLPIPAQATNGVWTLTGLAAGRGHVLAIKSDGTLAGWGDNTYGQATPPQGLSGVIAVAAGDSHSVALTANRRVVCWGWAGDPGDDITSPPATLSNVFALAAGHFHTLALTGAPPLLTAQPQDALAAMSAPASFSVTVSGSPALYYQWLKNGAPISGATGASFTLPSAQPADEGLYSVLVTNYAGAALSAAAALVVKAPPLVTAQPQALTLTEGFGGSFSVTASGAPPLRYQWRRDSAPLSGSTNSVLSILSAQAADAGSYTVVITNIWGATTSAPALLTVRLLPHIVASPQSQTVPAGASVSFSASALNAEGWQWRKNNADIPGATNPAFTLNNAVVADSGLYSVRVTNRYGLADSAGATLQVLAPDCAAGSPLAGWGLQVVWALDRYADLAPPCGLTNIVAIAAGTNHSLALSASGALTGWGDNHYGQAAPPAGLSGVSGVAAGGNFSLALLSDGSVRAWGQSDYGQTNVPGGLSGVTGIAAGATHALALLANGTIQGWGNPASGRATVPPGVSGFSAVAAGLEHSLGLRSNGTVFAWGANTRGQASPPAFLANPATARVIAVAAGGFHSLALRDDGTVVAWGAGDFGQTNVPAGLPKAAAIAAGDSFSVALLQNGRLAAWGQDFDGQVSGAGALSGLVAVSAAGNRGLAIPRGELRLRALRPAGSTSRTNILLISSSDGAAFSDFRRARITVQWAQDPRGAWTPSPAPLVPSGAQLRLDDPVGTNRLPRFYRAAERP